MIVVNIHLKSARDGRLEHLGSLAICNDGTGTKALRNYDVQVFSRGQKPRLIRKGRVEQHPAEAEPIFELVTKALLASRYGRERPKPLTSFEDAAVRYCRARLSGERLDEADDNDASVDGVWQENVEHYWLEVLAAARREKGVERGS